MDAVPSRGEAFGVGADVALICGEAGTAVTSPGRVLSVRVAVVAVSSPAVRFVTPSVVVDVLVLVVVVVLSALLVVDGSAIFRPALRTSESSRSIRSVSGTASLNARASSIGNVGCSAETYSSQGAMESTATCAEPARS
jgi:hypothetical protein